MSYDQNNIFAKILRGEVPSYKIYEDDKTYAFMDIMPRTTGHTLVIPKAPARNLLDVRESDLAALIIVTQKIGKVAMKTFTAQGLTIQQFSETAGGQEVFHLHFHILPRFEGIQLLPPGKMADKSVLEENARKLREALEE